MEPLLFVTATDKFLSGWGPAKGKTNKYVLVCEGWAEAEYVANALDRRPEMKYVNINIRKPNYPKHSHLITFGDRSTAPRYYPENK